MKLRAIIDEINKGNLKIIANRKLIDETLYRMDKGLWILYTPENIVKYLVLSIHEVYGHIGIGKCYKMFKRDSTSDYLIKMFKQLIKCCDTCQQYKYAQIHMNAETSCIVPKEKRELISVDSYGSLPRSTGVVRYIL